MRLFIEPFDVLFFRDGKPFMAGEAHLAQSLFPPTALTFQGAIRTAILTASGISVERFKRAQPGSADSETQALIEEIGDSTSFGSLRLEGPFVAEMSPATRIVEAYYPCPTDVVTSRKEENGVNQRLRPIEAPVWSSDLPAGLRPVWATTEARVETASGFISRAELSRYLAGNVPVVRPAGEFVRRESRFGIALSNGKKVAQEGMLYALEMLRLQSETGRQVGFVVDVEGTTRLHQQGMIALGGERRAATYETIAASPFPSVVNIAGMIDATRRCLLYMATPAVHTQDPVWLPDFIDPTTLIGSRAGVTIRVVAVAAGRRVPLGGWDLARDRPKPMQPAVPAGSVYWCDVLEGTGDAVVQAFHGQHLSSMFAEIGFGLTFVGRWPDV